jgi:23S rRNA pseudouridine2605 synthase
MRIAKYLAACGVASRRVAEKIIASGEVTVDGEVVTNLATQILPQQIVHVDGKVVSPFERRRIWLFHKPRGHLTTRSDPQGRKTIYDILPQELTNVITVGRLDMNSEGLLLLTNDGEFARAMELPSSQISRHYRVRISGHLSAEMIEEMQNGMQIMTQKGEYVNYKPCKVFVPEHSGGRNRWISIVLKEGKNREIRNMLEHFDLQVSRLIRTQYGDFTLGDLPIGACAEVDG